jgi:hypothetical protein
MSAALPIIGLVAGLAGTGVAAFSSIQAGNQQANAMRMQKSGLEYQAQTVQAQNEAQAQNLEYNQEVAERNAATARTAGEAQGRQLRLKQARLAGSVAAGYGGSGVTMAGTPLEVMNENTRLMENDLLTQRYNTEVQAGGFDTQAKQLGWEAGVTRSMGGSAASFYNTAASYYGDQAAGATTAGWMGAGSTLLGGAYKFMPSLGGSSKPSFGLDLSGSEMATGA